MNPLQIWEHTVLSFFHVDQCEITRNKDRYNINLATVSASFTHTAVLLTLLTLLGKQRHTHMHIHAQTDTHMKQRVAYKYMNAYNILTKAYLQATMRTYIGMRLLDRITKRFLVSAK